MSWPQWVMAALLVLQVVAAFIMHDKVPKNKICAVRSTIGAAMIALLLHAGGFWS